MLDIKKINNSVVVVSDDNIFYPNDNTNSYPLNSLMVVVDESDMAIFKSAANGDVLFSALIEDLTINGSKTSKDTLFNDLDSVISAPQGGGGGGTVDAYTKDESDAKFATKEYAEDIAANSASDIRDEIGTYVSEISDYVDNGKINYMHKNIAEGRTEAKEIPFKTINGQNVLGEGNIEIQGGGGTVDAYTKAESDAKYGTKAEQESLRGDVENALGEIAALGYDKADKKDTYTKAEVDEKLSDVKGGDEHYKSVVTDGMGDAPVITVINGEIVTPDPTPNSDGITIIMQQGTWKFKRTNTSVPIFKLSTWEQGEAELGYWNNSKSCFVFRDDVISFENGFFSSEWLVNGKTIKKSFNVNFETGAELHFGTEWSESDSLEIRKIDEFNGQFYLENFGYAYADDLTPRRNYKTIDNAIEVDYRGDKYHLLPKEQLKTINGQSIVGTGNLTVTDSSIQSYSSGSATSGTYYKINGSAINKWNDKQDKLTAGDGITIEGNVISAVGGMDDIKDHFTYEDDYTIDEKSRNVLVKKYVSEYGYNDVIIGNGKYSENESKVFIISEQLEEAIPTYIKEISPNKDYLATFCGRKNGTAVTITPDRTLKIHNYPYIIPKRKSEFLYIYESDTKDGDYRLTEPDMNDNYIIKEKKWYKFIIYDVNNVGFFDNNIIFDIFTFQNGTMTVEANAQWTKWDETNIDNSLYYQDGSELTPILTQKNISKYVDIQGGGDVDLSNYPTKQEVNQTYLQKEGEYVKSVSANGGAINFEKGNGTPDVVNFKTINNQSIFGMDNIKVPTDQDVENKVDEYLNERVFGNETALAVTQIGFWEEANQMTWVKSTLSGTHTQDDSQYFKTINGQSILGQGDIVVSGGGSIDMSNYYTKNEVDNLIPKIWSGTQSEYDRLATHYEDTLYLIKEEEDNGGYL